MTKNQVDKAGRILAKGNESQAAIDQAIELIGQWRALHAAPMESFNAAMAQISMATGIDALTARRLKRMESIRSKLATTPRASTMQDIAGCRMIVATPTEVYRIAEAFRQPREGFVRQFETDYIQDPKPSGYRGLHMIFEYTGRHAECHGRMVELQIRSVLQHTWSTAVETIGTFIGHNLKASEGPPEWLRLFQLVSGAIAVGESCTLVPGVPDSFKQLIHELKQNTLATKAHEWTLAFKVGVEHVRTMGPEVEWFILKLDYSDLENVQLGIHPFVDLQTASAQYVETEKEISAGKKLDAVLVSVRSIAELSEAYPNYFGSLEGIAGILNRILKLPDD